MFGFSKKPQARKTLRAAFEVILIGRKDDRTRILESIEGTLPALSESVLDGANPYLVAADATRDHILATLKKCTPEERVELLERIADRRFDDLPHVFELIAHVNYCLTILEDKSKPLVPPGSAEAFLSAVSKWFGASDKLLRRVMAYFAECTEIHRYHLHQTRLRNERKMR